MNIQSCPLAAALILALACSSGCKQAQGERCQVESDCQSGLVCCVTEDNRAVGGQCQPAARCEVTRSDSGTTDATGGDGTLDAAPADTTVADAADAAEDQAADQATPVDTTPDTAPDVTADTGGTDSASTD